MGIKKLLPMITTVKESNLKDFAGKTIGVDGYAWIHKCVAGLGHELVVMNHKETYFRKMGAYVDRLLARKVRVVIVLDGDKLPTKSNTEKDRSELREEKKQLAMAHLNSGNIDGANQKLSESYDVTPQLAYETINYLKQQGKAFDCREL